MLRWVALTTPAVTVGSALPSRYTKGFPSATTHSPIIRSVLWPVVTGRRLPASIRITAMSVNGSSPSRVAGWSDPSARLTMIFSAPFTTC